MLESELKNSSVGGSDIINSAPSVISSILVINAVTSKITSQCFIQTLLFSDALYLSAIYVDIRISTCRS
jgi:hypothetical protein